MVDTDLIELILRYVVFPVILGIIALGLFTFYERTRNFRLDGQENRRSEVEGARRTYEKVMEDAERLLSMMKYHAWNVAWRKMRPEGIFSEDLVEEDMQKWKEYDGALIQWRRNKIQNKTAIEVYFGKKDAASRLFKLIDATFDKLSYELWFIYHENPNNPNVFMEYYVEDIEQHYDTVFNSIMTAVDKDITRDQEENVHRITSIAFDELQDKVNRLCFEMSESIRKENVGNLRRGGRLTARK